MAFYLRNNNEVVRSLLSKGSAYTQEEKERLIDELLSFAGEILGYYKRLRQEGLVEITTSPLYHPIVPLLLDMNCAKEAVPDIKLPVLPVGFRDDAYVHVKRGKKIAEDWFGTITGIWPRRAV